VVPDCEEGGMEEPDGSTAGNADRGCGGKVHGVQYQRERVPADHGDQLWDGKNFPASRADAR